MHLAAALRRRWPIHTVGDQCNGRGVVNRLLSGGASRCSDRRSDWIKRLMLKDSPKQLLHHVTVG